MDNNKSKEKEFFDKHTDENTRGIIDSMYTNMLVHKIREEFKKYLLSNGKNKPVLEIGCGVDGFAILLARNSADVTGIDISENSIRIAKEQAVQMGVYDIKYMVMDAEYLEFEENKFDLIFGAAILHHLDLSKSVDEICRVLKKDGRAVFIEPLGLNPFIRLFRYLTPGYRTPDEHPLSKRDLSNLMKRFEKNDLKFFFLFSLLILPIAKNPRFVSLVNFMHRLDSLFFRAVPFSRYFAWQVLITLERPLSGLR